MLGLFKKKPKATRAIAKTILRYRAQGINNIDINFYIADQILFQVLPAHHFKEKGLNVNSPEEMAVVHFFNKNKTHTYYAWDAFKDATHTEAFLTYEEPKGIFFYLKNIGHQPKAIEQEILHQITHYRLSDYSKISVQYVV